jgi:hypothetical protein
VGARSVTVALDALGIAVFAGMWLGGWALLHRAASRYGVLAPVAAGAGLRLLVMVTVHVATLRSGDGGLMFLDDKAYLAEGMRIAAGWRDGHLFNPSDINYAGTYMFGYQAFCGLIFVLTPNIIAGKLVNVLAGSATVLLVALLADRLLGSPARRRAAWMAAVAPGLVWWSTPLMKEALACLLVTASLLAILHLFSGRAALAFAVTWSALLLTRPAAAVALAFAAVVVLVGAAWHTGRRTAVRRMSVVTAIMIVAGIAVLAAQAAGDPAAVADSYRLVIQRMVDQYRQSSPALIPVDVGRSLISPYPWAFDPATRNWDRGLYPGMWTWYALYPLAIAGIYRLRQRPETWLLVLCSASYLMLNAFTSGFIFRQRSAIEPVVLVLAVGGMRSWRSLARSAAAAWLVVAVVAGAHTGSLMTFGIVALAAGVAALASVRLKAAPLEIAPKMRLVAALDELASARDTVRRSACAGLRSWRALRSTAPPLGLTAPPWTTLIASFVKAVRPALPVHSPTRDHSFADEAIVPTSASTDIGMRAREARLPATRAAASPRATGAARRSVELLRAAGPSVVPGSSAPGLGLRLSVVGALAAMAACMRSGAVLLSTMRAAAPPLALPRGTGRARRPVSLLRAAAPSVSLEPPALRLEPRLPVIAGIRGAAPCLEPAP